MPALMLHHGLCCFMEINFGFLFALNRLQRTMNFAQSADLRKSASDMDDMFDFFQSSRETMDHNKHSIPF